MTCFADLKNDFVFRRVFGEHPELLSALLDDLLGRQGSEAIAGLELLSPGDAPPLQGATLPLVTVRCRDARRTTFVVELQVLHVDGFLKRAIRDACHTYADQPGRGGAYRELDDVVGVTICDFELWSDREQDERRAPRVPLLSRWRMTEADSGADGPGHVQHVFLELAKLPGRPPESGAERWAWLFHYGAHQTEVPAQLLGPYRRALELCDEATFSAGERESYRRARDAIEQTRQLARDAEVRGRREGHQTGHREGFVQGKRDGLLEGEVKGRRDALRSVLQRWLDRPGLSVGAADRERVEREANVEMLDLWVRRWIMGERVEAVLPEPVEEPEADFEVFTRPPPASGGPPKSGPPPIPASVRPPPTVRPPPRVPALPRIPAPLRPAGGGKGGAGGGRDRSGST